MPMSLTALRQELFKVVDQLILTGTPVEINRKGHIVKIILDDEKSKLANLTPHDCVIGDPEELVDISLHEWDHGEHL